MNNDKESVVIIGAGEIGSAIKKILEQKELELLIWDKDVNKIPDQKPLTEIIPNADFLFICTPSWTLQEVLLNIKPLLSNTTIVVSLAKGINEQSNHTTDELMKKFLPENQNFALLGGAMLAEELLAGLSGIGVIATKEIDTFKKLANLFSQTNLLVEYSEDIHGTALAGILKNIYAVALGIADGLNWSSNQKGWLVSKSVGEMLDIIKILGGKEETIYGIAGLGDLIATGYSSYSLNRQAGENLVKTNEVMKSEGVVSLPPLFSMLDGKIEQLPLLTTLEKVITKNKDPKDAFEQFVSGLKPNL
ncbi:MAG: 2-dehydropantoate 2-reductase N-terminal domain-containing protein [Candidatus Paceibacterota bacterium]